MNFESKSGQADTSEPGRRARHSNPTALSARAKPCLGTRCRDRLHKSTSTWIFHPGMINALNGQPGGGKTWVALHTCAEAIKQGCNRPVHRPRGQPQVVHRGRPRRLECSRDEIVERFHYGAQAAP